jgi:5-methylcytosine-specific restriction enzyme subunit McrC
VRTVPVANIYFLLCYAWDRLEERDVVRVETEGITQLVNLFGRVLASGTIHLLKRGLDRAYQVRDERIQGVRGRLLISETLKLNLLPQARTLSQYDELSYDVPHNQIVKATIGSLLRVSDLDPGLRESLAALRRRLDDVTDIRLSTSAFRSVQLHRNIRFYDFLLKTCRLIHENLMINQSSGSARFRDFSRDERAMASLFQRFLYNFYRREQRVYDVSSPHIRWNEVLASEDDLAYLPTMQTDIVLRSPEGVIVIDAKYYHDALQTHRGKRTVRSAHLYQILSYLNNIPAAGKEAVRGILLYPAVEESFAFNYVLNDRPVSLQTIDLSRPWREVSAELLHLINRSSVAD